MLMRGSDEIAAGRLLEESRVLRIEQRVRFARLEAILKLQAEWCANTRIVFEQKRARRRVPRYRRVSDLTRATTQAQDEIRQATAALRVSAEHLLAAIRQLPGLTENPVAYTPAKPAD